MKKFITLSLLLIALSACGAKADSSKPDEMSGMDMSESGSEVAMMNISMTEWSISLDSREIPAGETMFHVTNNGVSPHTLKFGSESVDVNPGELKVLTMNLKPGIYNLECPKYDHGERGMRTELVVK